MSRTVKPSIIAACIGVTAAVFVPHASALQRATPDGATAIAQRAGAIPASLRRQYYANPVGQPGIAADGGAIQYFSGSLGDGAIVWSARTGAQLVYGPYLEFFENNGEEKGLGFPISDPIRKRDARCDSDAYATQTFERTSRVGGTQLGVNATVLCQRSDDPRTGVYEGASIN